MTVEHALARRQSWGQMLGRLGDLLFSNALTDSVLREPSHRAALDKLGRVRILMKKIGEIYQKNQINNIDLKVLETYIDSLLFLIRSTYDLSAQVLRKRVPNSITLPVSLAKIEKMLQSNTISLPHTLDTLTPAHSGFKMIKTLRDEAKMGRAILSLYKKRESIFIKVKTPQQKVILHQELTTFLNWHLLWLHLSLSSFFIDLFGENLFNQHVKIPRREFIKLVKNA